MLFIILEAKELLCSLLDWVGIVVLPKRLRYEGGPSIVMSTYRGGGLVDSLYDGGGGSISGYCTSWVDSTSIKLSLDAKESTLVELSLDALEPKDETLSLLLLIDSEESVFI